MITVITGVARRFVKGEKCLQSLLMLRGNLSASTLANRQVHQPHMDPH